MYSLLLKPQPVAWRRNDAHLLLSKYNPMTSDSNRALLWTLHAWPLGKNDKIGFNSGFIRISYNFCGNVLWCIPKEVSDESATFTVVGAIALQGIRLVQPTLGETVVVTGLGLIGLMTVQVWEEFGLRGSISRQQSNSAGTTQQCRCFICRYGVQTTKGKLSLHVHKEQQLYQQKPERTFNCHSKK